MSSYPASTGSQSAQLQQRLARMRSELDWIYDLDAKLALASHGQAKLSRLVGELTRLLNMSYSVLLVPSRNIRISMTHGNWKQVDRRNLDQKLLKRIVPRYADSHKPVVLQLPHAPSGAEGLTGPCQLVVQTLSDEHDDMKGVLACFCRVDGLPLDNGVDRQMAYVARRAKAVIADSFDALTGLMRRDNFEKLLYASQAELDGQPEQHCLIYFDIDQLQLLNDRFDTAAGDDTITRFARILQAEAPVGASICRVSGDKFAVLLRHATADDGVLFSEQVREQCKTLTCWRDGHSMQVTVSASVVAVADDEGTPQDLLIAARIACEKAKDHGRNRTVTYNSSDRSIVRRVDNMELFARLQTAIAERDFKLDAQPIISLTDETRTPHYEILARMRTSSDAIFMPDQFMPAAEQYKLMPQLDRLVVSMFFEQIAEYEDQIGFEGAMFSLNLSGQSLSEPVFHEQVAEAVRNCWLEPSQICFEITETAAIANRQAAVEFIGALREIGCKFALDDFGAGLSSFAYLRDLPVDILKIDGSFVRELTTSKVAESMVAAIAQVARVMGLQTVAEYVETEETRLALKAMGVDYGQGYLSGRPRSLNAILGQLAGDDDSTMIDLDGGMPAQQRQSI